MLLSSVDAITGAKTFDSGKVIYAGASSGTTTLNATAVAGTTTLTLPAATDTLIGKATTDTLTNKTFDANGTGNSLSNVDVADLANGTDGELITWDAAGAPTVVAVGTATHVLTSNGVGVAPTFQAGGTVTSVASGSGLTGGTITATGTLSVPSDGIEVDMIDTGVNAIGSIGGGTQDIELTGNGHRAVTGTVDTSTTTFTFSNPKASGEEDGFYLILTNGGSQTIVWPASVDWVGGTAPALTAAGLDHLVFTTVDGGTIWNGFVVGLDVQ